MTCFYDLTQESVYVCEEEYSSDHGYNSDEPSPFETRKEKSCPVSGAMCETPESKSISPAPEETPRGSHVNKEAPGTAVAPNNHTGTFFIDRLNLLDLKSPSIKLLLLRQDETEEGDPRMILEKIWDLKFPIDIGRRISQTPDLTNGLFNDRLVSRKHAILYAEGDKVLLQDVGSTHGTFVNNQRVLTIRELHDGDRVNLGQLSKWKSPYIVQIFRGSGRKEPGDVNDTEKQQRDETRKRKREVDAIDDVAYFIFDNLDNVENRIAKRIRFSSAISAILGGVVGGLSVGCAIVGLANMG